MGTKSDRSAGTQFTPRGVTQGNILVCPNTGNPIDSVVDNDGVTRLAVDSSITAIIDNISVALDPSEDGIHVGDKDTGSLLKVETDGSVNVNTEVDAADGDNIAVSAHPNQIFDEDSDTITTAGFEEIYSYTSTSNSTRIMKVEATAETSCVFRLKIDGVIKRTRRSSPIQRNVEFEFNEHRTLSSGEVLTVEAKIEVSRVTTYETFTSLEGYLA